MPTLLWIDDDGPERFRYEEAVLRERWTVDWAATVAEAADKLSRITYSAIILDQMLPLTEKYGPKDIWGGCAVVWWLIRGEFPPAMLNSHSYQPLLSKQGLHANKGVPLCVVSAYENDAVWRAIEGAGRKDIKLRAKPIVLDQVCDFLEGVK